MITSIKNMHPTKLIINVEALIKNIAVNRERLNNSTKIMLMIKAFAYGAGDVVIAQKLEAAKALDYLGVAYVNEGIALREEGINLPIMVMNTGVIDLKEVLAFSLEPTIYNPTQLEELIKLNSHDFTAVGIHLKIDSGMHRLGFHLDEIKTTVEKLTEKNIKIKGVYTHLSASPNPEFDDFTQEQLAYFDQCYAVLVETIDYKPMRHVLNSAGIIRFNNHQYEMVRAGMSVYGIDPARLIQDKLTPVSHLVTEISQINILMKGDTVGYERQGKIDFNNTRIAILPIGYADGYNRHFGNGNAEVFINGKRAPTIGNICMDMTFVDVTNVECKVGDKVELFGANIDIQELAKAAGTIDYEILTSIGPRVAREYV